MERERMVLMGGMVMVMGMVRGIEMEMGMGTLQMGWWMIKASDGVTLPMSMGVTDVEDQTTLLQDACTTCPRLSRIISSLSPHILLKNRFNRHPFYPTTGALLSLHLVLTVPHLIRPSTSLLVLHLLHFTQKALLLNKPYFILVAYHPFSCCEYLETCWIMGECWKW
jgi:hypothetical protein